MKDPKHLIPPALFGAIDGLGLAIGLLLVLHNKSAAVIAAAAAANAASELAGMSSGQFLSTRGEHNRAPRAAANGLGAFAGALVPVLIYIPLGAYGAAVVLMGMVVAIAAVLPSVPWYRSWLETGATVGIVVAVCAIAAAVV